MGTDRPSWMDEAKRPKQQVPPPAPRRKYIDQPSASTRGGTHRNVVIGVTILTVLTLFTVFYWIGIGITVAVNPLEPSFGYLDMSAGRMLFGAIVGVVGTVAAWMITDSIVE